MFRELWVFLYRNHWKLACRNKCILGVKQYVDLHCMCGDSCSNYIKPWWDIIWNNEYRATLLCYIWYIGYICYRAKVVIPGITGIVLWEEITQTLPLLEFRRMNTLTSTECMPFSQYYHQAWSCTPPATNYFTTHSFLYLSGSSTYSHNSNPTSTTKHSHGTTMGFSLSHFLVH